MRQKRTIAKRIRLRMNQRLTMKERMHNLIGMGCFVSFFLKCMTCMGAISVSVKNSESDHSVDIAAEYVEPVVPMSFFSSLIHQGIRL